MNTRWHTQHRPVLAKVVADHDQGMTTVDPAAYAAALQMTQDEIDASLDVLRDARFLEADDIVGSGQLKITRVCPLARQIIAGRPSTKPDAENTYQAYKPAGAGAMFDEIVLKPTAPQVDMPTMPDLA